MIKTNKGVSLLEVLIASVILVIVVAGTAATYVSLKKMTFEMSYRYTAMNLAKEMLEWGEAGQFNHAFSMKYYYPPPPDACSLSDGCTALYGSCYAGNPAVASHDCCPPTGTNSAWVKLGEGYRAKEWCMFCICNSDPFDPLGDIKSKGLVPKNAPDSVVIHYVAYKDTDLPAYAPWRQTVEITWQENPGGPRKKIAMSVLPIRALNDVLTLNTTEFWWE
jgi:prepilin-type N-terminal cleavage/methylation domain-containing protein